MISLVRPACRLPWVLLYAALATPFVAAQQGPGGAPQGRNPATHLLGAERLALQGYDPVAYFEEGGGRATRGSADLAQEYEGVVYHFAVEANRTRFVAAPERYEPAFGGWCAYAMAQDQQVQIDPRAFRIGEGRLLLFADADYVRFDGRWVPEEHALLARADAHWQARSGETARAAPPGSWRALGHYNLSDDSLALEGYDPVAYFPEGGGTPRKGMPTLFLRHDGVLYRFANDKDRELFQASPARFEPQHGGWCSYAMGKSGEKVVVDPTAFRLTNGQLHLFYVGWFSDTREDWDKDTARLKAQADAAWAKLTTPAKGG